jgi:hypothetical protein
MNIFLASTCQLKSAVSDLGYTPDVTAWEDICHSDDTFAWISYEEIKSTGRWSCVRRSRKWIMRIYNPGKRGFIISKVLEKAYGSLDAAKKAAADFLSKK